MSKRKKHSPEFKREAVGLAIGESSPVKVSPSLTEA